MKKFINRKTIFSFIIGLLLSATTVYATIVMQSSNVEYDYLESNLKDSNGNNVEDVQTAIDALYTLANTSSGECQNGYIKQSIDNYRYYCEKPRSITLKVGDLVEMTPTAEPFDANTTYTGYSSTQRITPSELKLWRVIRVNSNGTYDAVSEYVSSVDVSFSGINGYKYYIYYLNELAKKYENSNYTVGSRYMGYNGQTQTIQDTSAFDGTSNSVPWTCSTGGPCNPDETKGGGDTGYTTDLDLVKAAYGGTADSYAKAYKMGTDGNPTTTATSYWLASRYYIYNYQYYGNNFSITTFHFEGRYVSTGGSLYSGDFRYNGSSADASAALRPIITLKSDLTATGNGTSEEPYVLQ